MPAPIFVEIMMIKHMATDQELIERFQKDGSELAISELIKRYKRNIYTAIYVKVKDKHTAEDIFQEAFLKIVNTIAAGKYSDQGKFLPWAVRIANNLCIDYFRKSKQTNKVITQENFDWMEYLRVDYSNAQKEMENRQTADQLQKLLERLPEEQRDVIVLRVYSDLSFKEIAELTNVGINTALGRMRYGLANLRKMINEHSLVLR